MTYLKVEIWIIEQYTLSQTSVVEKQATLKFGNFVGKFFQLTNWLAGCRGLYSTTCLSIAVGQSVTWKNFPRKSPNSSVVCCLTTPVWERQYNSNEDSAKMQRILSVGRSSRSHIVLHQKTSVFWIRPNIQIWSSQDRIEETKEKCRWKPTKVISSQ